MSRYTGLDRPKSKAYFTFWKLTFGVLLLAFIGLMYVASSSVEYPWSWSRLPQYFWVNEHVDVVAEVSGDIQNVSSEGDQISVHIVGPEGDELSRLPVGAELLVGEGDYVYLGDAIAKYEVSKPGLLIDGLWLTLKVSMIAIVLGIILGVLTGLARISENPALRWSAVTYIELIRGSPLLVQIFLWYFVAGNLVNAVLQELGWDAVPSIWYGVLALAVFAGAYVAEIVRAGIQSVHRGQNEAARSLGLTQAQAMRKVILPQAFRRIMPPLAGQFISLIKDSSLLGVIAIRDLTKATREIASSSLMSYELWITCALLYLVLTFALSLCVQYLEKRALR